jgi:excisionase family DNA binding protein
MAESPQPRFLPVSEVAEILNVSVAQAYALVRRGDLPAIRVGGRGQWRVETRVLEDYIANAYRDTERYIRAHPFAAESAASDADGSVD